MIAWRRILWTIFGWRSVGLHYTFRPGFPAVFRLLRKWPYGVPYAKVFGLGIHYVALMDDGSACRISGEGTDTYVSKWELAPWCRP